MRGDLIGEIKGLGPEMLEDEIPHPNISQASRFHCRNNGNSCARRMLHDPEASNRAPTRRTHRCGNRNVDVPGYRAAKVYILRQPPDALAGMPSDWQSREDAERRI